MHTGWNRQKQMSVIVRPANGKDVKASVARDSA